MPLFSAPTSSWLWEWVVIGTAILTTIVLLSLIIAAAVESSKRQQRQQVLVVANPRSNVYGRLPEDVQVSPRSAAVISGMPASSGSTTTTTESISYDPRPFAY